MDSTSLTQIVAREVAAYAGEMLNGKLYFTVSPDNRVFAVLAIDNKHNDYSGDASLIARIDGDKVVIEHDMYDRQLVDALLAVGVPREQIVLAYFGESLPEIA